MSFGSAIVLIAMIALAGLCVGILVAPMIGDLFGGMLVGLIYSSRKYDRAQPVYGIPASQRAKGLYEEAIRGYLQLAADYPDELQPYIEMIDIAIVDLRDEERARFFLQKGLAELKNENDKLALPHIFEAIRTRLQPEPEWMIQQRVHTLVPPDTRDLRPAEPDGGTARRFHAGGARRDREPDEMPYQESRIKISFHKRQQPEPIPRKSRVAVKP